MSDFPKKIIVPYEPTKEMISAGVAQAEENGYEDFSKKDAKEVWYVMWFTYFNETQKIEKT